MKKPPTWNPEGNVRWVEVTPEEARALLDRWNTGNRRINQRNLDRLRTNVAHDGWIPCDTVQVAGQWGKSRLLNGQHRLEFIASGDVARWILVAENVPTTRFDSMDTGKMRSPADTLTSIHPTLINVDAVVAFMRLRMQWEEDGPEGIRTSTKQFPNHRYAETVKTPGFVAEAEELVGLGRVVARRLPSFGGAPMSMALWLISEREGVEVAREFADAVISPQRGGDGDPLAALDRAAQTIARRASTGSRKATVYEQLAYVLKAFDAWMTGAPVQRLLFNAGTHAFPW